MILYPAIDLKDGECVRLLYGNMESATVYADDPSAQARLFADSGAEWIHVVDLNGAFTGQSANADSVEAILDAIEIPVQLGGGIRKRESIDAWLARGVSRVVLGTAALTDPDLVKQACADHPGKIAVAVDSRGGKAAVEGWAKVSEITAADLARRFEDCGVAALIHTNVDRDGAKVGVDVDSTATLAETVSIPVIASGGLASLDDLRALLARAESGIEGVISGRAIYDGTIDLRAALGMLAGPPGRAA